MIDTLQARLDEVEAHAAHQDKAVDDLNAVMLDQREELDRLTRRVNVMLTRLEALEAAAPAPEVTKPPHY